MKLDIGAGDYPLPGFTSVDAYNDRAAVHAPLWDLPFEDGSVDIVHSSHSLEHVSKHVVPAALAEWHRVLRPGGELWLEVPNLDWVCSYWLRTSGNRDFAMDVIFGLQTDAGQRHMTGFNARILQDCLEEAGFGELPIEAVEVSEGGWADPAPPWEGWPVGVITGVWSHGQGCLRVKAVRP